MTSQKIPIRSGVRFKPLVKKDWRFGSSGLDTEIKVADGDWTPYLPSNEKQRRGFESMCCTNFSSTSNIEKLFTRKIKLKLLSTRNLQWLQNNGYFDDNGFINFSDRFDALVSNTSPQWGNFLKTVAEAKKEYGMIPERMLPWVEDKDEYFDKSKITPEMYALGLEFLKRFPINYEFPLRSEFEEALKISPLAGACFAWGKVINGVYQRDDRSINHAIDIFNPLTYWNIQDSYIPFIKKLATNYTFYDYAIRYIVGENTDVSNESVKEDMYILKRNPHDSEEIFAFTQDMRFRRHIVNKKTLEEGAIAKDQQWVWHERMVVVVATPEEWNGSEEIAEILLLPKDSKVTITTTAGGFNFWAWLKRALRV